MANSPSIVLASLSDDQLKKSIDSLVTHVDEAMKKMVQSTNNAVGEMEAKLKSLGNLKIDSGGTNDGGAGRRTQQHEKLTKAVNDASEAVSKETQKLQDLQQSLSGASDREQNFISQKERAANTIAQENELLKQQEQELSNLKSQQSSFGGASQQTTASIEKQREAVANLKNEVKYWQSIVSQIQSGDKKTRFNSLWIGDTTSKQGHDILDVANKLYSIMQKLGMETEKGSASTGQAVKVVEQLAKYYKISREEAEKLVMSVQESPLARGKFTTHYDTRFGLDNLTMQKKDAEDSALRLLIAQSKLERQTDDLALANKRLADSENSSTQSSQQKAQIDAQVAAKEKEIAETKGRIATATREQTEAERNASQAAREKANIQSQVANQEKQVAEAKKQLTTATQQHTEAEVKSSRATKEKTITLDQQASAINTVVQSEKKYTDEVLRQAAAIRATKEWQEKGHVVVGDVNYYDKERANVSKRDKQLMLSLEEQIVQVQQKEAQEALIAADAARQQAQAQKQVKQEALGTAQILKTVHEMQSRSASGIRGNGKVNTFTIELESAKALSAKLKELKSQYENMNAGQRLSKDGQAIAQQIREITRQGQKLNNELNRPTKKEVFGLSEKTLDDIAYKMRQLASYRSGLNIKTQSEEIEQVNKKYAELQKGMNDIMRKNTEMIKSNTALGRSWNYMKNRLAFYFTVGASTSFIKNLIEIRSQYEMNERALGILIDSAERGTRIFNELSQMALVSPYTLIELSTAAKQLTAYDIAAKDVVDTTRRLADMASAVGIPIERLTYALGQIKAYGYLNARDARMFSNAGIPLVKQLADYYTELEGKMVSTADVYDRIKKKAIDMSDVMQVINKMTDEGGKFFDFQAKMAGTLKVQLANLTLAWNNMLNDIGASEQGVISSGIKMLKELFLRWKDINKAIENIAIALGVAKAAHLVYYGVVMGTNKAIAIETVLGTKLSNVLRNLGATMNTVLTSAATWWTLLGVAAGAAVIEVLRGNEAMKEFNKALRENAENTYNDLKKFSEQYSIIRKDLYKTENGKQTPVDMDEKEAKKAWEALREQIELSSHASDEYIGRLLSIENVSERLRQGFAVIDSIQSVSAAIKELGDDTIKLEKDWSAWWNLGLLPDGTIGNLKDTYMWLSKIEEKYGSIVNARKVASTSKTSEGFDNVFQEEARQFVENYEEELEKFRKDLQVTKQSVIDFIELKGWNGDVNKINEAFKTFTDNLVLKNQLNPQQAYTLQLEMEEARSQATKQALLTRINDEKAALKETRDAEQRAALIASINENVNEYNTWSDFNGRKKVEWERFTKWLKEQHISETTAMFRNMDAEDIKSLNFQEGQHADWVNRMVTQYAKEHKMSYDEAFNYLKSWVTSANQWSVFIPLVISTEDKKTVYQQLGEYDKLVDEADAQIERLTKRINELKKKKEKDKEETEELTKAEQELAQAQKDKADAEAKGGHGKKEKKDARNAAKAQKQAESELQKALKEELQLIDKVRGAYKNLTKEGVSSLDAISLSTSGFEKSVSNINKVLGKYGIGQIDLKKFAGIENPHKLVEMLELQLNKLLKSGVAKPSEIQDLEVKIRDLKLDAKSFDSKTIVEGLNNELGKLKDEYELAVELDANPELGDMFLDMFGIDKSALSSSIDDYMFAVQDEFRKKSQELGYSGWDIDVFKANEDTWKDWGKNAGLSDEALDKFKAKFVEAQNVVKKTVQDTVKQTKDLEYKLADTQGKIAIETTRLKKLQADREIADAKSKDMSLTEEQRAFFANQKSLFDLQIKDQENTIARLGDEVLQMLPTYKNLFNSIVEHSDVATRKIAKQWKGALSKAVRDGDNFVITDPNDPTKTATITKKQYGTEVGKVDKELQKSTPVFKKIKEAFKKGEDGTTDWAKGIGLLGGELEKLAGIVSSIGNFAEQLGFSRETVEIINDVATSMSGVATMSQGVGQIASGDYIGGAASMISGLMTTVGTWLDNSDNKILDQIKESERAVKKLENAMIDLEDAANHAYGAITSGAQRGVIANKELQLAELKRQIQLEKSRDSKHRDEDRIVELEGQYKQLLLEVKNGIEDVVNEMLGISSAGDAVTQLVESMIEAFRNGEDAMQAFSDKWDEMIDNMILKIIVSQYMQKAWEHVLGVLRKKEEEFLANSSSDKALAQSNIDAFNAMSDREKAEFLGIAYWSMPGERGWDASKLEKLSEEYIAHWTEVLNKANQAGEDASEDYLKWSLDYMMGEGRDYMQGVAKNLIDGLGDWYTFGQDKDSALSALQQGIQGITEDTAGAIEAYLNGISQQIYLHSTLLTEIRDAIVGISGGDLQLGVQSQMLLQLQDSYTVQKSIESILAGVLNPSGRAFNVELIS